MKLVTRRAYWRDYYHAHHARRIAQARAWCLAHPKRSKKITLLAQLRAKLRQVGMTLEEYRRRERVQKGKCKICRKKPRGHRLAVDHKDKKARGLLCIPCNLILGNAYDNPTTLRRAARYLCASL